MVGLWQSALRTVLQQFDVELLIISSIEVPSPSKSYSLPYSFIQVLYDILAKFYF